MKSVSVTLATLEQALEYSGTHSVHDTQYKRKLKSTHTHAEPHIHQLTISPECA